MTGWFWGTHMTKRKPPYGIWGFSSKVQEIVFEPNGIAQDIKRYRSWIKWQVPWKLVKIKDIKRIQKVPKVARQGGLSWCFFGLASIINLGFFLSTSAQLSSTQLNSIFFPNHTLDPFHPAPLPVFPPQPRRHPQAQQLCIRRRRRDRKEVNRLGWSCWMVVNTWWCSSCQFFKYHRIKLASKIGDFRPAVQIYWES